jgi:hypothetical protein
MIRTTAEAKAMKWTMFMALLAGAAFARSAGGADPFFEHSYAAIGYAAVIGIDHYSSQKWPQCSMRSKMPAPSRAVSLAEL